MSPGCLCFYLLTCFHVLLRPESFWICGMWSNLNVDSSVPTIFPLLFTLILKLKLYDCLSERNDIHNEKNQCQLSWAYNALTVCVPIRGTVPRKEPAGEILLPPIFSPFIALNNVIVWLTLFCMDNCTRIIHSIHLAMGLGWCVSNFVPTENTDSLVCLYLLSVKKVRYQASG